MKRFVFTEDRPTDGQKPLWSVIEGDALHGLRLVPDNSVRCWVTSPPYYRKVDYGVKGQYGLERTVAEYIAQQAAVAREMLRASTSDANLFWVIQDTYNGSGGTGGDYRVGKGKYRVASIKGPREKGVARKAQLLVPERTRLAFADVGWVPILKLIWDKDDPRLWAHDRPSYSYEEILLFAASPDHFWNGDAVLIAGAKASQSQRSKPYTKRGTPGLYEPYGEQNPSDIKRNILRSMEKRGGNARVRAVLRIPSGMQPRITLNGELKRGRACFPQILADVCVALGSAPGDTVGDPYAGWGTTLLAALKMGRNAVGVELNPERVTIIEKRLEMTGYGRG